MITHVNSCAVIGIEGAHISIEVDVCKGHPSFNIVGLTDTAIQESKERIRSAIRNSGFVFPYSKRVIINLAPAHLKKVGAAYDIGIALGILFSANRLRMDLNKCLFIGELSLDGKVKPVKGLLPILLFTKKNKYKKVFLPEGNLNESEIVSGIEKIPVKSLIETYEIITNNKLYVPKKIIHQNESLQKERKYDIDLIKGQYLAKRALEIVAAGAHSIIMSGPPGTGKTLLANSLPGLLPKMNEQEKIEVASIYSVISPLSIIERPFRAPHHSCSGRAFLGGGNIPMPGEITLAHRGVLFLDELPEFQKKVLESLRQPLENGYIVINRAGYSVNFPCKFILVAAQNPCPCGFYLNTNRQCTCSSYQIAQYNNKISGPLKDRFDIKVELSQIQGNELFSYKYDNDGKNRASRIKIARNIQNERFKEQNIYTNSEICYSDVEKFCKMTKDAKRILISARDKMGLSARAAHKILKIARTIADLDQQKLIQSNHISESIQYRF